MMVPAESFVETINVSASFVGILAPVATGLFWLWRLYRGKTKRYPLRRDVYRLLDLYSHLKSQGIESKELKERVEFEIEKVFYISLVPKWERILYTLLMFSMIALAALLGILLAVGQNTGELSSEAVAVLGIYTALIFGCAVPFANWLGADALNRRLLESQPERLRILLPKPITEVPEPAPKASRWSLFRRK